MGLVNAGRNHIASAIIGGAVTAFNNANAYIGLGDSNTALNVAQTDLQAASNKVRKAQEASFPTIATNVLTWKSVFGISDANYAIEEAAVFNASSVGTMLCRKVGSLGTKTSAQIWTVTYEQTLGI